VARDQYDPRNHHLWQSDGGMIYVKIAIPAEVRERFPRTETGKIKDRITESTGTDSWVQAREFRDLRLAHWKTIFARLASGAALTPEEMASERQRVHRSALQTLLATAPLTDFEDKKLNEVWAASIRAQQPGLVAEVTAEVRAIADAKYGAGVITEDSETWKEIWKLVARAKAKAFEDRLVLLFRSRNALSEFSSEQPTPSAHPTAPVNGSNGNGNGLEPFSVALDHYIADLRKNNKRETTVRDFKARGVRFVEFAKDPALASVTIDNAKDFLKKLAEDGLSAATVNNHHWLCKAVFEHARVERRKFSGDNPFEFSKQKHKVQNKAKFTLDDLQALFSAEIFTTRQVKPKAYDADTATPWAALISLYTGAGLEEICQLRPSDVRQENGVWLFHITPDAALAKDLKRDARERKVPVHSELKRLGALKYHAALPRGTERLFPNLPVSKAKRKFGPSVGKRFAKWRDSVGVARPGEQLDFHSFRHTVSKWFEDIGVPQNDAARVLGHGVDGITYGVYSRPEVKRLARVVERIKWNGLRIK
jgi:integrase